MRVSLRSLYAWEPKALATLDDVRRGSFSHSAHLPVRVSRLDSPRGAFFVIDGHHRVVEAILRGDAGIDAEVDPHIPRIERTGGAYRYKLEGKVRVVDLVPAARRPRRG